MPLMAYIKLVRPLNLAILAVSLILIARIMSIFTVSAGLPSTELLFLVVLSTLSITAGGNVINDIYDMEADRHNKPDQWYVGRVVSVSQAFWYYLLLCFIALVFSILSYLQTGNGWLMIVFLGAMVILYLYSRYLKRIPAIGNLTIAGLCALSIWVVPLAVNQSNSPDFDKNSAISILSLYTVFAFLTTLHREVVKDLIDKEGDELAGVKTLAHILMPRHSKFLQQSLLILVIICLLYTLSVSTRFGSIATYYILGLIASGFLLLGKIRSLQQNDHLRRMSYYLKLYMIQGILLLAFI